MNIKELTSFDFPNDIIEVWKSDDFNELMPIQKEAIDKGLFQGQNLLIVAPTSSGKTFIGEMAAVHHSYNNRKSLYLVPFKAISDEKYEEFKEKYSDLGFSICISDKDHKDDDENIRTGNYQLAVLTYEKLTGMLVNTPGLLKNCDCVIVDEVQMMSDSQRGGNLELLLTKIKESPKKTQIIALSAVLGELNGFDKWLGAELIQVYERPVELRQGILFTNGEFEYTEWNTKNTGIEKINAFDLNGLIKYLIEQDEQIVIIKNSIPQSQKLALALAKVFSYLPSSSKTIGEMQDEHETETRDDLLITLRSSIAFHNSDCELKERRIVEKGFREKHIKILVSTTTLSMGVNLPCKTVILADHKRWEVTHEDFQEVNWSVGEVRNIFGRAGRTGQSHDYGRGIFLANSSLEKERLKRSYFNTPLESFTSALENRDISLRVLDVVASGYGNYEEEIENLIFRTYAARSWKSENTQNQIKGYIKSGIEKCISNGLLEQSTIGKINVSEIGKVCASMGCSIESFQLLKEYLETADELDLCELIYIISKTEEVNVSHYGSNIKWDNREFKNKIQERLMVEYSNDEMRGAYLKEYEEIEGAFISRKKIICFSFALLFKDILLTDNSLSSIKKAYNFSIANIRKIASNLSWLTDVTCQLAIILKPQYVEQLEKINSSILNKSTMDSYFLNKLSDLLLREEKIRLVNAGIVSMDDLLEQDASDIKGIINPKKFDKVIKFINDKREKNSKFWETEHIRRVEVIGFDSEIIKALYSANGIDLEHKICSFFETKFINCNVSRISEQRKGEPDLLLLFEDGERFTIQVTAKEDNNKFIDSKKAGDVISQSARLEPNGYICIGRPDFQELAIEQAMHLGKMHNFKLIPLYSLVELYVRVNEGEISKDEVTSYIRNSRGYISIGAINNYFN